MHRSTTPLMMFGIATVIAAVARVGLSADDPEHVQRLRETRECRGCNLAFASLDGVNVELGDLREADLQGASLYAANLRGADLTGALLTDTDLKSADLRDTKGVNLSGAKTDERTQCPSGALGPCN